MKFWPWRQSAHHGEPITIKLNRTDQCIFCLGWHPRYCGRVRQITWDGEHPKSVEYWNDWEWDRSNVLFLDTEKVGSEIVFIQVEDA